MEEEGRNMVIIIASWVAALVAIDIALVGFGLLSAVQLLERAALPSLFLAWVVSPAEPFPAGFGKIIASKAIAVCCRTLVLGMQDAIY